MKNYSDSVTPNAHVKVAINPAKEPFLVSDYGVTGLARNADLAFTKAANPVVNSAIVKPTDSTVIYTNGGIAYINFNFDTVDTLPSLTGRERLLSNLPVAKTTCYLYIKAFNSQSMQRCEIYNGTLMLLHENRLEAGKTYNGVIMYPLK